MPTQGKTGGIIFIAIQQDCEHALSGPNINIQRLETQSLLLLACSDGCSKDVQVSVAVMFPGAI